MPFISFCIIELIPPQSDVIHGTPKAFASEIGLNQNTPVELSVEEGKLVLQAMPLPEYSLSGLLDLVTEENLHAEVEAGAAVGGEAW